MSPLTLDTAVSEVEFLFNAFGKVRKSQEHTDKSGVRSVFLEFGTSDEAAMAVEFTGYPIKGTVVTVTAVSPEFERLLRRRIEEDEKKNEKSDDTGDK